MDEAKQIKEEVATNTGLTTATLAGVVAKPEVRAVAAPSFGVGGGSSAGAATAPAMDKQAVPLFSTDEAKEFRARWDAIQASFVDEPRRVVEQADSLVAVAMKRLAEMFAAERARLEGQWDRGDDVSTEDLRLALQRYRSFFGRILSV
ncbi:MAG TPA: hypothetical protein VNH65_21235 [Candidatus Acidoferrum sp.]|nr:hypothetical protein [Candidatus Acidoferrum sp.]